MNDDVSIKDEERFCFSCSALVARELSMKLPYPLVLTSPSGRTHNHRQPALYPVNMKYLGVLALTRSPYLRSVGECIE